MSLDGIFFVFAPNMQVDQRSISHRTRGIRISLLVLSIWGNYFSRWWQLHWNTTGTTREPKFVKLRSTYHFTHKLVYHNSGLASKTFRTNRIFIISGNLGTNKDRWNFWTFGIKVYHTNSLFDKEYQIRIEFFTKTEKKLLDKFTGIITKLSTPIASSIIEPLVSTDNQGTSKLLIHYGSINAPHYPRRDIKLRINLAEADLTYCESVICNNHIKGIIWPFQTQPSNLIHLCTIRGDMLTPVNKSNTKKRSAEFSEPNPGEMQQSDVTTRPTYREESEEEDDMDICHSAPVVTSAVGGATLAVAKCPTPPTFDAYWLDPCNEQNPPEFYHIAAMVYQLGTRHVEHPQLHELITVLRSYVTSTYTDLDTVLTTLVLNKRKQPGTAVHVPRYLETFEVWVRGVIREQNEEMPEAYRVLGLCYKLMVADVRDAWSHAGNIDMDNVVQAMAGLSAHVLMQEELTQAIERYRGEWQMNRMRIIDNYATNICVLLDGAAEDEASTALPAGCKAMDLLQVFIKRHADACVSWVKATSAKTPKQRSGITCGKTDQYMPLPAWQGAAPVAIESYYEVISVEEKAKLDRTMRNQRGRVHALHPVIAPTNWPDDAPDVDSRNLLLDKLTRFDTYTFMSRIVQIIGLQKPSNSDVSQAESSSVSLKDRLRTEIVNALKYAGR